MHTGRATDGDNELRDGQKEGRFCTAVSRPSNIGADTYPLRLLKGFMPNSKVSRRTENTLMLQSQYATFFLQYDR